MKELSILLTGDETVNIIERLCAATGMSPSCLVALMVRKYGQDLESWMGYSSALESLSNHNEPKTKIELPTDPGENLPPVEL